MHRIPNRDAVNDLGTALIHIFFLETLNTLYEFSYRFVFEVQSGLTSI